VYVPWTVNANAYQWTARALDFNWRVSSQPTVGSILVLQPFVQGASYLGHVAVVESVLSNGQVIASSMNWGPDYSSVSTFEFVPGSGVSFVSAR
jgi:N-acetylmuramoyl-L-alanine amidase